jgi:hypothetical protein
MGKNRFGLFENRVLRRILGPKREEVVGSRRKLDNEEFRNLSSPDVISIAKRRRVHGE